MMASTLSGRVRTASTWKHARVTVFCVVAVPVVAIACTSSYEDIGSQRAHLITFAPTNAPASGTFFGRSEATAAYANGVVTPAGQGVWVSTWNTGARGPAWGSSTDRFATQWVATEATSPLAFGQPNPPGACDKGLLASYGFGDAWVAPDYNPQWNQSYQRVFYTALGATNRTVGVPEGVIIAYSDTGGQTAFQSASWVDDKTSCGNVDSPMIASHLTAPSGTYVSWDDFASTTGNNGRLQQVWFDNTTPKAHLHEGFPSGCIVGQNCVAIDIPDGSQQRHRIGVGTLPSACTSGGEGVFVTSVSGFSSARCSGSAGNRCFAPGLNTWMISTYDAGNGVWYPHTGPFTFATATGSCPGNTGPQCLADTAAVYNVPDPSIAVQPDTSDFWVATTTVVNGSNRVHVDGYSLVCNGGLATYQHNNSTTTPDPCDPADPQCQLPDGGIVLQDEWQPQIAFVDHLGNRDVVVSWYGTRDDPANHFVGVYMMYSEDGGYTWSPVQRISQPSPPWDPNVPSFQNMWDYNASGVDPFNQAVLAIWGGDNRTPGQSLIETELMQ